MTERVANVNQYQYADQVHHHDAALTKERFQPVYRKEYKKTVKQPISTELFFKTSGKFFPVIRKAFKICPSQFKKTIPTAIFV